MSRSVIPSVDHRRILEGALLELRCAVLQQLAQKRGFVVRRTLVSELAQTSNDRKAFERIIDYNRGPMGFVRRLFSRFVH